MRVTVVSLVTLLVGCGGSDPASSADPDGGSDAVADTVTPDTTPADGGADTGVPPADSSPIDAADTGTACTPTAGAANLKAYCDLFELALFERDGAAARVELRGRVSLGSPEPTCAIVDKIEVQTGGTTVATLSGGAPFGPGSERALLASGASFPALATRCAADKDRFGGFGFRITGRMDGGTFTAQCADAEGGSRWPPAVRVTCHKNVDASPFAASATITSGKFTSLNVSVPHGPSGALTTVNGTLRVIPGSPTAFGGPPAPAPFDSAGWTGSLSEATTPTPYTSLSLLNTTTPLPAELCPKASTPGPGVAPPPVFLARITGIGGHGAYSTEAYVNQCTPLP